MKKKIRFEHNIIFPKSEDGCITMRILEFQNDSPRMLFEIQIVHQLNVDDYYYVQYYLPHLN